MRTLALCLLPCLLLALPADAEEGDDGAWARLQRMDRDGDGRITRDEFRGPERLWRRLDADGDGVVTKAEAAKMPSRGRGRAGGLSFEKLDTNGDGRISKPEWDAFLKTADENEDRILQREEWDAAVGGGAMRDPAPAVGAKAPAVSARRLGTELDVDLASPKRTTVLVLGSWT